MVTSINTATANASEVNGSEKATDHSPLANRVTPVTTSTISKAAGAESEGCWSGFVNFIMSIWDWIFCGCGSKKEKNEPVASTATSPAPNSATAATPAAEPQQTSAPTPVEPTATSIQEPASTQTEPESPYAPFLPDDLGQSSSSNPDDIVLGLGINVSRLEAQLSEVRAKLDKAEAEGRSDRAHIRNQDLEIDQKDVEVKAGKERIEALEGQIVELTAEKAKLEKDFQDLKSAKEAHEQECAEVAQGQSDDGKTIMRLQAELRQAADQLKAKETTLQAVCAERDQLKVQVNELEETISEKKAELEDYKEKAAKSDKELKDLQKVADELKEKWNKLMASFAQVAMSQDGPMTLQAHMHQNMKSQLDIMVSVNDLFKALPSELKESSRFLEAYKIYCQRFSGLDFEGYEVVPTSLMAHLGVLNSFAMGILNALGETISSPENAEYKKLMAEFDNQKNAVMQDMRPALEAIDAYNKANRVVSDKLFHNIAILSEFIKSKSEEASSSSSSAAAERSESEAKKSDEGSTSSTPAEESKVDNAKEGSSSSSAPAESEVENEEEESIAAAIAQEIANQNKNAEKPVDGAVEMVEESSVNNAVKSESESELPVEQDSSKDPISEDSKESAESQAGDDSEVDLTQSFVKLFGSETADSTKE